MVRLADSPNGGQAGGAVVEVAIGEHVSEAKVGRVGAFVEGVEELAPLLGAILVVVLEAEPLARVIDDLDPLEAEVVRRVVVDKHLLSEDLVQLLDVGLGQNSGFTGAVLDVIEEWIVDADQELASLRPSLEQVFPGMALIGDFH